MNEEHKKALGIDDTMSVTYTGSKNENRKGQDNDIEFYDVFDASGALIAKCEVRESMGIYPPHKKTTELRKFAPNGVARLD
ncbi:hypothetical protein [Caballeronia sp. LZ035]|uniref:hypothetical protein n=1 Tax=Caballeronia sp. LZ035 TaxID=3038568 RepID=UPI00286B07C7|nr:hypothetical protein [Caballeronia sp. LZ035]